MTRKILATVLAAAAMAFELCHGSLEANLTTV